MTDFINEKPYVYESSNGTKFTCTRSDLADKIKYGNEEIITIEQLMTDVAEMAAMHAMFTHPELNGFAGYDTLRFEEEL
jgi:methyl coenzyme M reductase subunit D